MRVKPSKFNRLMPKTWTPNTPKTTSCSPTSSSSCRNVSRDSRKLMTNALRRFGQWTTKKLVTSSKRSCMLTKSSISNNSLSSGSPLETNSSLSCLNQTPWLETRATKELTPPLKATLSWTRTPRSWTLRAVTMPRPSLSPSWSMTRVLAPKTRIRLGRSTSEWSKSLGSWSRRPLILSTIKQLRDAWMLALRSSSRSRSIPSARV